MLTCKRCDAPTEMRWDGLCRKCYIPPTTPGITEHLEIDLQAFQPKLAEKLRETLGVNMKAPIPNLTEDELSDFQEVVDKQLAKEEKIKEWTAKFGELDDPETLHKVSKVIKEIKKAEKDG